MSKGKNRVGRNPLEKLSPRNSDSKLQPTFSKKLRGETSFVEKLRQMQIQFDWQQFYDQAVPNKLKSLVERKG